MATATLLDNLKGKTEKIFPIDYHANSGRGFYKKYSYY